MAFVGATVFEIGSVLMVVEAIQAGGKCFISSSCWLMGMGWGRGASEERYEGLGLDANERGHLGG